MYANHAPAAAPAPEVYQAGVNQNLNAEPQAGAPAGKASQKNQVNLAAQNNAIQDIARQILASQGAAQQTNNTPAAQTIEPEGKVSQSRFQKGQAESAQKSGAQGGERQANETDRRETIAQEEKVAQNGSDEAREENEENNGREKSAQEPENKKAADEGGGEALDLNDKEAVKKFADSLTYDDIPMEEIPHELIDEIHNSSNEENLQKAVDYLESKQGEQFIDPLENELYFKPGDTESMEQYAIHLIAGDEAAKAKDISKIRDIRVLGVFLAEKTLENPLAIVEQESNHRRVYISIYKGDVNYANSLIIGVEKGQDGRIVTVFMSGNKRDKKAALRDFKKRLSGENTSKVLYLRVGLSGHSRSTTEHRTSPGSTSLRPSGTQSIPQNRQEGKEKRNAYSDVIDEVTRELAESRPRPTLPGRKRGSGAYVPGVIDDVTRMIREQDGGRPESNTEKTDTESKQETASEQTSQKEIQNTTFTFGGKEKINQYETAYTVNMDKAPSKDAVRAMLEDYNNVKVSGKTLTFYNKDAADKFLSDMEKTYGSKVVRQADKHNGFLKNMSPMQQAKADKTLSNLTRYEGQTMTNGELIEKLVAEGREPKEKAGKRGTEYRLYKEDGTFIDLTKTEYDYAKYLTKKQESAPEVSNTSMEEQAETVKGESNNGQEQEQSGGVDGGHEVERAGESEADERSSAGEVSGRDGREGTRVHGSAGEENSGGSRPAGVRTGTELEEATGNGDNSGRDSADVQLTPAQEDPTPTEIPGHDYEIKDSDQNKKNEKVRFQQNIDAIKLLKRLEEENRMPTPAEQEVLGAYNGWGGLKKVFLDDAKENKELRELLTDEEYNAAKSTMNDAFYTPPKIVRAIWEGVSRLGFKGGRILDPSMGVGNFFGCMPRAMMKRSDMRGVEIDNLTSRFAKQLYPNAFVENKPFQKANVADNFFDLVISNIPFGQTKIDGYQIHNYFFANGMDKVRPGGLMVFITSQGTLTGGQDAAKMRSYLDGRADMIAAYKLPSGAFSEAGTDVGTDVIIFQKRGEDGKKSKYAQPFLEVTEKKDGNRYYPSKLYDINEYFEAHPENIIGEAKAGHDQYGNPALEVKPRKGETVEEGLAKAMKSLPENLYAPVTRETKKAFDTTAANKQARADEKTRELEYYTKGGKVLQNQDGKAVPVTGKKGEVLKDYIAVKQDLAALQIAERDPKATDGQLDSLRKALNNSYNAFTKKHGRLNGPATARIYQDDPSAGMVQALEKVTFEGVGRKRKIKKIEKADIFTQRVVQPVQEIKSADTPAEALLASLANKGRVALDYMAGLLKSTADKVASALKGKIYKNPVTEEYESREEYLSGNVREKLAQAEAAAKRDKAYQANVDALKKVIPEDLVSDEIIVNMGAPWIPVSDMQGFVSSIQGYGKLTISFSPGAAKWTVDGYGANPKYEAKGIKLKDMLESILNNKAIEIYDKEKDSEGKEIKVLNQEQTDAANVAAEEIRRDFTEWLWSDKDREKRLVRYYNDNYNNQVTREYDGTHLTFPGMNSKITLKPHQKNVVWRMLQKGNTLIAHCVGAGKTFEMQAAGMEMRRLGIANKPLYCLPNNVVEQFAREFRQLYPNAKLLVLQSSSLPAVPKIKNGYKLTKEKTEDGRRNTSADRLSGLPAAEREKIVKARAERNRTLARIRTEDWDGIIISHDMFQRLPLTPETVAGYVSEEIEALTRVIMEAKGTSNLNKRDLSNLEQRRASLRAKMDEILSTDLEDIGIPFEELGIDQIFVDEADLFKNLHYNTRMDRVSGLSNSDANRSNDMFVKTQWLTQAMGGRGVVFATGTPVSNTMAELYTMMRYLDMRGLKEKGLDLFDNWIRTFAEIGSGIERKPSGDGYRKVNKVKRFVNMADLNKMFRKFADVKTQDDIDLEIPKLKNDKATIIKLEADPEITHYIKEEVPRRVANMKHAKKGEKGSDNMLALTGDLRKMSLNDDKIEACAEQIAKKYEETTDVKGAQLVFCDMGIPKAQKDNATDTDAETDSDADETENASTYEKLIASLKAKGIPAKQIAFVQSAKNKQEMDELFQKVNEGEVRVLIGSTSKMGAGTNCQKHLVALHDLDAPWRPRDLEQRHGRILRQGNENKEIEIFNYVVQDSFDANMWEKLKNKAAIIAQAMSGDTTLRAVEDADLVTLSYAEVEGAATGSPLIKERLNLSNELTKYQHAQTALKRRIRDAESTVAGHPDMIAAQKGIVEKVQEDIKERTDTTGDKFHMVLNHKTFTERAKAQAEIEKLLPIIKKSASVNIGEIAGFKLNALYNQGKVELRLVNHRAYEVKTGSIAGIENTLKKSPEAALAYHRGQTEVLERQLDEAEELLRQPNPYEEKIKEMTRRLAEIDREIEASMVENGRQAQTEETEAPDEAASMEAEEAPERKNTPEEGGESAPVSESALEYDGNYFVQETDDYRKLAMGVDPQIRKFAEENGGKWEPGVAGERGGFRFQTKSGAKEFLAGVDDVITRAKQSGESATVAKTSFEASIGKSNLRVSSDGYITGDTYHVKETIKKYGAKWDKDKKAWHITDKNELNRFLENYGENYSGEILNERQEDVSNLSTQERIDRAVAASENNRNLAAQLGGVTRDGKMTFADTEQGRKFLDAVNAQDMHDATQYSIRAWHGSPHIFDKFDLGAIGTGEGAQVHGWGLYFAQDREVSEGYREALSSTDDERVRIDGVEYQKTNDGWVGIDEDGNGFQFDVRSKESVILAKVDDGITDSIAAIDYLREDYNQAIENEENGYQTEFPSEAIGEAIEYLQMNDIEILPNGSLFQVEIPDNDVLLDEQKTFAEQPEKVREAIANYLREYQNRYSYKQDGDEFVLYDGKREVDRYDDEDMVKDAVAENNDSLTEDVDKYFPGNLNELTGKQVYRGFAQLLRGDKEASEKLNELGIKGITYVGGQDGRCFVIFDDEATEIINKFSASEKNARIQELLASRRFLDAKELTAQHKKIAEFGGQMGVPVVFFEAAPALHGYHQGGVTFLNVRSEIPIQDVFWHESFHWMRNNNLGLYADLMARMQEMDAFSNEELDAYRESIGRPELTNKQAIEEMLADIMMDTERREDIMQRIAAADRGLIERFMAWLRETAKTFQEFMKNPDAGLTRAKIVAMNRTIAAFARKCVDGNGNHVFRVTPRGEILRANGGALPAYSANAKENWENSLAGNQEVEGENNSQKPKKITDRITLHPDGFLEVRLKYPRPGRETQREGMNRRTKEITELVKDANTEAGAHGIFVNALSKEERANIDERLANGETREAIAKGFKLEYNRTLANFSDGVSEEQVISRLIKLKGREYHAREYAKGSNAGGKLGNRHDDNGRVVRMDGGTQQGTGASPKIQYSINLGNKGRSGNQGGLSRGAKPSFMGIIRNKLAGFVGDGTMRIRKEMKDALERAAGVAIRAGHIDSMTSVKTEGGVIRTRNAYDWETILPEAGKAIAKRLGLDPSDKMGDYIGRWILDGALNDTSQEAADFQKAMRKHPELQDKILDAHDIFQEWNNMDADKRIEASVQWTPRGTLERLLLGDTSIKDELAEAQKNWYDEWIEELGSLGRLEESIEKKTGKKIRGQDSALRAFRLLRGATGKFMTMIEGKDAQAVEAIKRLFPNVDFEGFKTLHMILDDAGVRQDKEGMRQFMTYCIAKHSMSIHKKNEDLELEQLNLERKLKQAKTEKEKAELRAQIVELGQQIMQAPNTRKDAEATIAKFAKRFGKAQQDLVRFSRVTMDIMVDSGLVSEARRDEMAKAWPDYVPFFRVFDENEDVQFGDSLKHVSGSKRDLVNPLESIIKNTFEFVRRAEKNKAKLKIANLAKMSDVGEYIQLVDAAKPEDKTVLDYYEDGKKKFIQTDPTIVTAIRNMGLQSSTMFSRILRFPAQIARAAFTMVNPSFAVRNVLRDSADAYLYSKYGYNPLKDFARGFMHALKQDEMFYEWMASGAAQASMISLDRDYTQSAINNITRTWQERLVHNPLDLLQIAGEYSEYATRIGAYERAKNEIIKRDATISDMGAITEAAFESRDLMDFSRGGKSSRAINQLIIFSNASIQGWDKFFRTFDFRKDKKAAMAALARLAISAILPSIALFMLNYDKDWWKEIPDWQKEKHWIIKVGDTILRIPKGQDPGIQFFSNLVEKGMGAMVNKDPIKFNRVVRPLWNTMPDFLPTTFMPFIEVGANYSFFTERNIVPQYQKKLPEKMQYGPHTSSFAKWLGEKIGVAPSHIDHIIAGYGGNLARGVFNVYDQFAGNQPLNTSKEEMPIISGLTIMPYKNPKSVQEYYEKLDEQEKLYNEFKMTHVRPDGYDPVLYSRMKKARTSLQKLSRMERSLMNNPNVSLDDRKARQEQIQARRIEIIKRVLGR